MRLILCLLGILCSTFSLAQSNYRELPDPHPADQAPWKNLKDGTYIRFASPDIRYGKNEVPTESLSPSGWQGKAWKGEKVHTQLVIWTTRPLEKVSLEVGALTDGKGNRIPAEQIQADFVRYVMADGLNDKGSGCGIPDNLDSTLVADVIDVADDLPVAANTTQPVWLSINVPEDVPAGTYKGKINVKEGSRRNLGTLNYSVEVVNRTLPAPKDWAFHLNLWQSPDAIARVHGVEKWSDEHLEVMKPYMEMLADAGQKVITTTLIYDPWNSQTHDIYSSMIKWTKKKDGTWSYDYTAFDKWVSAMMALGIDNMIECYSMIPWNLKFYYYDEALGKDTVLVAEPGTPAYRAHWQPMLNDFAKHLKQKGWFDKTLIAMDERPMEAMQKAIAVIKDADKDFKISLAGNYHPEIQKDLYYYTVASNQAVEAATMQEREKAGYVTSFYTACPEAYPNTFTFSPPAEAAWMGWHAANKNYDGYLRWAYNSWPPNPLQDSRFRSWSSGDTYFVYPGYRSSIRFERLIEGIEDFEKIRILREEFKKNNQQDKLRKLEAVVGAFKLEALKTTPAADMLHKAQQALNAF
ncbi:DUF4091 domain-containing protein [Pontibacter russatus]|uniref:DUF4091 domain-containing protein n=1 Tax=Pontibacter russatus TaxID=2694929 RepID=UPI00137B617D|nr:DUF4091 domain-containing protein [Pontibacter russatus]